MNFDTFQEQGSGWGELAPVNGGGSERSLRASQLMEYFVKERYAGQDTLCRVESIVEQDQVW
jgi:hypothetical protein